MRITPSPTEVFERRVAASEGGVSVTAVASHQLARALAILNLADCGDHLVAVSPLQDQTVTLFSHTLLHLGIRTRITARYDLKAVADALDHQTRAVFIETSGDATGSSDEIRALARLAHDFNVPLVVDHSVGSPAVKPLQRGADIVLLSTSRWRGQSDVECGSVIVDGGRFKWSMTSRFQHRFGDTTGDTLAYTTRLRTHLLPTLGVPMSASTASQLLDAMSSTGPFVQSDGTHVQGVAA